MKITGVRILSSGSPNALHYFGQVLLCWSLSLSLKFEWAGPLVFSVLLLFLLESRLMRGEILVISATRKTSEMPCEMPTTRSKGSREALAKDFIISKQA